MDEYVRPRLHHVVEIAAQLSRDGSLPTPLGEHGRRSEFISRCSKVLKAIGPEAVCKLSELDEAEASIVRQALGEKEVPYDGCLNEECMDSETTWMDPVDLSLPGEEPLVMTRCASCKLPKSFGRSWKTLQDLTRPYSERQRVNNYRWWTKILNP